MALLQVNFMSEALMRTVTINVILPVDKLALPGMLEPAQKPYKTLYLLNGIMGNYTDWANASTIQTLAEEKNLAVVMPSGENLFYLDYEPIHAMYGDFVGRELVEITRKMFRLSEKREDTFIGGLSMGGYGALRNGLKYSDRFGYIIALSSAMELYGIEQRTNDSPMFFERRNFAEFVFGDLKQVMESDKNPIWLAKQLVQSGKKLPKIYMACGTEDFLLSKNRRLQEDLRQTGLEVTYEEASGSHEWKFWSQQIKKALEWLPLETAKSGISSCNIGL